MSTSWSKEYKRFSRRTLSLITSFIFAFNFVVLPLPSHAQGAAQPALNLPAVGTMVTTTPAYVPTLIKGITIHPDNALMFDFVFEDGDRPLEGQALKEEFEKLIKYFLAALTVPEKDLWVNLSPYEGGKVIPVGLGDTEMGRDLLAQDYLLKQVTASLMYPEQELGRTFWDKVFERAYQLYGKTNIPLNTFNKVWIVPDKAVVLEQGRTALVVESHLKVMLEEDYAALEYSRDDEKFGLNRLEKKDADAITDVTAKIVREVLIPAIEEEVNNGETFANLRQIYHSMVLATWYKQSLKESLLGQVYVDQNKTQGVDTQDKEANRKIYAQYMEAFQKGVYDYIRHDYDKNEKRMVQRKYFSGGVDWRKFSSSPDIYQRKSVAEFKTSTLGEVGPQKLAEFSQLSQAVMATTADVKMAQEFNTAIHERLRDLPANDQKIFQEAAKTTAPRKIYTATTTLVENVPTATGVPYRAGTGVLPQITKAQIIQFKQDTSGMELNPAIQRYYADVADKIVEMPSASVKKIEFPTIQFSDISQEMASRKTPVPAYETSISVPLQSGSVVPSVVSIPDHKGVEQKFETTPLAMEIEREVARQIATPNPAGEIVFYATPANIEVVNKILEGPRLSSRINQELNPLSIRSTLQQAGVRNVRVEAAASPLLFENEKLVPLATAVDIGSVQEHAIEAAYNQSRENPSVTIVEGGRGGAGRMSSQVKDAIVDNLMENNAPIAIVMDGSNYVGAIVTPRIKDLIDVFETAGVPSKFFPQVAMTADKGLMVTSLPATAFQSMFEFVQGYPDLQKNLAQNGINKEPIRVFDIQGFTEKQATSSIQSLKGVVEVYRAMGRPLEIDPVTFEVEGVPSIDLMNPAGQFFSPEEIQTTFSGVEFLPETALTVINKTGKELKLPSTQNVSLQGVDGLRIENYAASPIDLNEPVYRDQLASVIDSGKKAFGVVIDAKGKMSIQDMDIAQISASPAQIPEISADAGNIHKKGGIDFNAAMLNLQIERDGAGVPLPISNQPIGEMNIQGFVPVILNIETAPAAPAPLILGEAQQPSEELTRVAN